MEHSMLDGIEHPIIKNIKVWGPRWPFSCGLGCNHHSALAQSRATTLAALGPMTALWLCNCFQENNLGDVSLAFVVFPVAGFVSFATTPNRMFDAMVVDGWAVMAMVDGDANRNRTRAPAGSIGLFGFVRRA